LLLGVRREIRPAGCPAPLVSPGRASPSLLLDLAAQGTPPA